METLFAFEHVEHILVLILGGALALLGAVFLIRFRRLERQLFAKTETLTLQEKELVQRRKTGVFYMPEAAKSVMVTMDRRGNITAANQTALDMFGYTQEEFLGRNASKTLLAPEPRRADRQVDKIFAYPQFYGEIETECVKKNGEHIWISWTNRVIYDSQGKPLEIRAVGFDISPRKKLEEELRFLASVDPLTGVLNSQALLESGSREVKRAQRYKRELSVLVLRLNYFHAMGNDDAFSDALLHEVVRLCRASSRESDILGRIGDVEFAFVLPETTKAKALILADRLKKQIQERNLKAGGLGFVTAAFGAADLRRPEDTIDSLLLGALKNLQKTCQEKRPPKKTQPRKAK